VWDSLFAFGGFMSNELYPIIKTKEGGTRCPSLADSVQKSRMMPEVKASLIVYEKYKRKYNLCHEDHQTITNHIIDFVLKREYKKSKETSLDHMIQEASAFCKKTFKP